MAEFNMKVAGQVARVRSNFDSTIEYCRPYLTREAPDFLLEVTQADMDFIQRDRIAEARAEGIRIRHYSGPYLERAVLQTKFAEHLLGCNTLLLHGSAVALDGEGYLFTAKCGTGKSTHTRLWREGFGRRAVMINDDKPFLRIESGGVLVCGSPWSGKHGLDANITVPLKGICILERGPKNRIERVTVEEALPMLLSQCHWDPGKWPRYQALAEELSRKVPLWHMECNKDPQAALVSYNAMSK